MNTDNTSLATRFGVVVIVVVGAGACVLLFVFAFIYDVVFEFLGCG